MRQGLPFELFLGLRYLRSRGQRTNLSLFAWIGVGGVFLGVGALIVVLAVMTGFQDGIRDKIIAGSPHLLVFQSGGQGLVGADAVAGQIQKVAGVRSATPFVHQQVLFTTATGGARGGLIRGVDLNTPAVLADVRSQLRGGTLEPLVEGAPMILLGRELARSLGVLPGDPVTVISPEGALTAVGMVPKMRRYIVAGMIEIGMHEYDSSMAYLSLPAAQEFAGIAGVTGIEVKLKDPFDAKVVGLAVAKLLGFRFWVRDWMEMNRSLFAALQLEKYALFVVVTIIVLVAAFAIIGHLVLLVAEKHKEIGILKAVGASGRSITLVFFAVGMIIGVAGTAAGAAVGFTLIWAQNTYKIIGLAADVYQIDYLPMRLTLFDGLMVVGSTLILSFLATIIPARRAGSLVPVDVLRYE
ncbi:MAG: lipoprotein-releasing system transmembrane subunit LolC [Candidatus Rokuibacteriota bacterium]|nr:MAG: lipoprotein-releasing system transmembrane subunit LolC [Candidatus Rokubacteria bacterium]